jgi:hypothetical protein
MENSAKNALIADINQALMTTKRTEESQKQGLKRQTKGKRKTSVFILPCSVHKVPSQLSSRHLLNINSYIDRFSYQFDINHINQSVYLFGQQYQGVLLSARGQRQNRQGLVFLGRLNRQVINVNRPLGKKPDQTSQRTGMVFH